MMIKVYGMSLSGNCYKLKLLLNLISQEHQWIEVDILNGETQTLDYLKKNPNGKVPLLEIDGTYLPESNAGLYYLSQNTPYFPTGKLEQAQVLQWMFFEQYSHEPAIAVARFINLFLPSDHPRRDSLPELLKKGYQALAVLEQQLNKTTWLVGDKPSIADIALYAYTHVATDGDFELTRFPKINQWMTGIQQLPNYIPMV